MKDLADRFLKNLRSHSSDISSVYFHLFSLLNKESLERDLRYLYELQDGGDDFFKEDGKENWFFIWHKSMRQGDLFQGIYYRKENEGLTKKERSEWSYLWDAFSENKKEKEAPKGSEHLFTDEYRRYLSLSEKKRKRNSEESVCGHLDMILWNTIHVDKENVLMKQFETFFVEVEEHEFNIHVESSEQ